MYYVLKQKLCGGISYASEHLDRTTSWNLTQHQQSYVLLENSHVLSSPIPLG